MTQRVDRIQAGRADVSPPGTASYGLFNFTADSGLGIARWRRAH